MKEIPVKFQDKNYAKIQAFKRFYDSIMEEESTMDEFIQFVTLRGLESILTDIIPQDPETLWNTILAISADDPDKFADFMIKPISNNEMKEEIKERLNYIG